MLYQQFNFSEAIVLAMAQIFLLDFVVLAGKIDKMLQ